MGKLLEELRNFLSTATPEQLEQALKEVEQFKDVGPTITEYIENMKEIKERYCSFEVAKLLKEKGFNEPCYTCYMQDEITHYDYPSRNEELIDGVISAPTHQMAMEWLREIHKIGIFPSTYTFINVGGTEESHPYGTAIINLVTYELMTDDIIPRCSYEEAVEAALKYVLENLI